MVRAVQILFSVCTLVLLLSSSATASDKPCVAAKMDDLSTVWVGETLGEYFRLQINPNGTGLLTAQWIVGKPARAYKVTQTNLSDRRVSFLLESLDAPNESLYLRGTACRGLLDLKIGSTAPKWELEVTLQPYTDLMARLQAVTVRADEHAQQVPPVKSEVVAAGMQVLPAYQHQRLAHFDTSRGIVAKSAGPSMKYEFGTLANNAAVAYRKETPTARTATLTANGHSYDMVFDEAAEVIVGTIDGFVNFTATNVKTRADVADILLMAMSFDDKKLY